MDNETQQAMSQFVDELEAAMIAAGIQMNNKMGLGSRITCEYSKKQNGAFSYVSRCCYHDETELLEL